MQLDTDPRDRQTPLELAVREVLNDKNADLSIVKELLAVVKDPYNSQLESHRNEYEMLHRRSIAAGAKNSPNFGNRTLEYKALVARRNDIFDLLVSKSSNPGKVRLALFSAAFADGQYKAAEYLLDQGIDLAALKGKAGNGLLFLAVERGDEHMAKKLLEKGVSVYVAPDPLDERAFDSALCMAVKKGHEKMVSLLLEHGASANENERNGDRALHIAAKNGDTKILALLLKNGANINTKNGAGKTSLDIAREAGKVERVIFLEKKQKQLAKLEQIRSEKGKIAKELDNQKKDFEKNKVNLEAISEEKRASVMQEYNKKVQDLAEQIRKLDERDDAYAKKVGFPLEVGKADEIDKGVVNKNDRNSIANAKNLPSSHGYHGADVNPAPSHGYHQADSPVNAEPLSSHGYHKTTIEQDRPTDLKYLSSDHYRQ